MGRELGMAVVKGRERFVCYEESNVSHVYSRLGSDVEVAFISRASTPVHLQPLIGRWVGSISVLHDAAGPNEIRS
jgi:hypothetical protein